MIMLVFLLTCQSIYFYSPIRFSYEHKLLLIAMRINLNQLRAFFLAAREKSITKAAEELEKRNREIDRTSN